MSLRRSPYVAPEPPKGAEKRKTAVFRVKSHFAWIKSTTKFLSVKTVSDKVVRHSLAWLSVQKWLVEYVPFCVKIWRILTTRFQNAEFRSIFARSASAVTPRGKVQLTLIGSPLRAFQWAQDKHRTLSLSPRKGGSKTQSVQNLNNLR